MTQSTKPGLDLSAFYSFYPQIQRPTIPAEIDLEWARKATRKLSIARPDAIKGIAEGITFDGAYVLMNVEDDIFSVETTKAITSSRNPLVSVTLSSFIGTSMAFEIGGRHGDISAMSVMDRSIALINGKSGPDLYYSVDLSHLDSSDGSDVDVELAEFAFATVVDWQIECDMQAIALSLCRHKIEASLSLSVSCESEALSPSIASDIETSSWNLMCDWSSDSKKSSLRPLALRCFGDDIAFAARSSA